MDTAKEDAPRERGVEENVKTWCPVDNKRTARRQRQSSHLHQCGPRCILEALLALEAGEPLDAVLADFERLPPATYHAAIAAFCDGGAR
jgi:hypothetical protein